VALKIGHAWTRRTRDLKGCPETPTRGPVEIRLPNRMIDHADERAAFFFVSNISSVATIGYDHRIVNPQNPPDKFTQSDTRGYQHHDEGAHRTQALGAVHCSMVGKRAGNALETTRLIMAVREIGRANLDALAEISQRLRSIGINRTLVRILDSLLWSAFQTRGPEAEFGRWLVRWHRGRLASRAAGRRPAAPGRCPRGTDAAGQVATTECGVRVIGSCSCPKSAELGPRGRLPVSAAGLQAGRRCGRCWRRLAVACCCSASRHLG
jgi:hypothetical protein